MIRPGFVSFLLFPFSIYSSLFWCQLQMSCVQMLFICLLCPFPQNTPLGMSFLCISQQVFIYWEKLSIKYQLNARRFSGEEKYL